MRPAVFMSFTKFLIYILISIQFLLSSCTAWTIYNLSEDGETVTCDHIGMEILKETKGCSVISGEIISLPNLPSDTDFIEFSVIDNKNNILFSSQHNSSDTVEVEFPVLSPGIESVSIVFSDDSGAVISRTYFEYSPLFAGVKFNREINIFRKELNNIVPAPFCSFDGPSIEPEKIRSVFSKNGRFLIVSSSVFEPSPGFMDPFVEHTPSGVETIIYDAVNCSEIQRISASGGIDSITYNPGNEPGISTFVYAALTNEQWTINRLFYNEKTKEKNLSTISIPMVSLSYPPWLFSTGDSIFIGDTSGRYSTFTENGKIFYGPVENPDDFLLCESTGVSVPAGHIPLPDRSGFFVNCIGIQDEVVFNNINFVDLSNSPPTIVAENADVSNRIIPFSMSMNHFGSFYPIHGFVSGNSNIFDWLIFHGDNTGILSREISLPHLETNLIFSTPIDEENILIYQSIMFSSVPGGAILNTLTFESTLTAVPLNFAVYVHDNVLLISTDDGLFLDSFEAVKNNNALIVSTDPYLHIASQY
ncbi:hypothetical protein KKF34_17510 [Myxococcota bacterium]|nr:hypothetical protein [Myxococcota bacterium]